MSYFMIDQLREGVLALQNIDPKTDTMLNLEDTLLAALLMRFSARNSNVTQITVGATSTLLLPSNPLRRGKLIYNSDKKNDVYIALGSDASPARFSFLLLAGSYWNSSLPIYLGGLSACAVGAPVLVNVTEFMG